MSSFIQHANSVDFLTLHIDDNYLKSSSAMLYLHEVKFFPQVAIRGEIILPLHTSSEESVSEKEICRIPTFKMKNHALSFKNQKVRLKSGHLEIK